MSRLDNFFNKINPSTVLTTSLISTVKTIVPEISDEENDNILMQLSELLHEGHHMAIDNKITQKDNYIEYEITFDVFYNYIVMSENEFRKSFRLKDSFIEYIECKNLRNLRYALAATIPTHVAKRVRITIDIYE